jgi:carboxylesterase type B
VRFARTAEIQRAQQRRRDAARLSDRRAPAVAAERRRRRASRARRSSALDKGEVARVPTLVGSNRDEWRLFTLFDPRQPRSRPNLRPRAARALRSADEAEADAGARVYRSERARGRAPRAVWEAVQSDRVFHHPAHSAPPTALGSSASRVALLFSWRPPLVGRPDRLGTHGMELPFVFGTLKDAAVPRRTLGVSESGAAPACRGRIARRVDCVRAPRCAGSRNGCPKWHAYDCPSARRSSWSRDPVLIPRAVRRRVGVLAHAAR